MSSKNVVRTGIAGRLQTGHYVDKPVSLLPNSTLNQKLGINPDQDISAEAVQAVRYIAIGNGGHDIVVGANGRKKWTAVNHTARHTAMYNQLPFVLRQIDNDLTAQERLKYRLRRIEEHNGVQYAAYYLRVLDLSNSEIVSELRHVDNGVTTATPYTPTLEDLNPVPPVLNPGQAVITTGDYIASSCKVTFTMSKEDIAEFNAAMEIIEGESGWAMISEMAIVAGVDATVNGVFNGETKQYTDVLRAQITSFIATAYVTEFQTDGLSINLDIGNVEPLLKASN